MDKIDDDLYGQNLILNFEFKNFISRFKLNYGRLFLLIEYYERLYLFFFLDLFDEKLWWKHNPLILHCLFLNFHSDYHYLNFHIELKIHYFQKILLLVWSFLTRGLQDLLQNLHRCQLRYRLNLTLTKNRFIYHHEIRKIKQYAIGNVIMCQSIIINQQFANISIQSLDMIVKIVLTIAQNQSLNLYRI